MSEEKIYDAEVLAQKGNSKQLLIRVYAKQNPDKTVLKGLPEVSYRVYPYMDRLIGIIKRIALPKGGTISLVEEGFITTPDNINIFVIRLTADRDFKTHDKETALKIISTIFHPANRWLINAAIDMKETEKNLITRRVNI